MQETLYLFFYFSTIGAQVVIKVWGTYSRKKMLFFSILSKLPFPPDLVLLVNNTKHEVFLFLWHITGALSVSLVCLATTSEHHLWRRGGNKWALIIWCPDLFFLYKLHVLYQSGTSRVLNFILPKSKRKTFEHCCRVPERGSWYSCSRTKRWKMCFLWVALTWIQHLKYIYLISLNLVPILMQPLHPNLR